MDMIFRIFLLILSDFEPCNSYKKILTKAKLKPKSRKIEKQNKTKQKFEKKKKKEKKERNYTKLALPKILGVGEGRGLKTKYPIILL